MVRVGYRLGPNPRVDTIRYNGRQMGPKAQPTDLRADGVDYVGGTVVRRFVRGPVGHTVRTGFAGRRSIHSAAGVRRRNSGAANPGRAGHNVPDNDVRGHTVRVLGRHVPGLQAFNVRRDGGPCAVLCVIRNHTGITALLRDEEPIRGRKTSDGLATRRRHERVSRRRNGIGHRMYMQGDATRFVHRTVHRLGEPQGADHRPGAVRIPRDGRHHRTDIVRVHYVRRDARGRGFE